MKLKKIFPHYYYNNQNHSKKLEKVTELLSQYNGSSDNLLAACRFTSMNMAVFLLINQIFLLSIVLILLLILSYLLFLKNTFLHIDY